jgi:hypothetical protein
MLYSDGYYVCKLIIKLVFALNISAAVGMTSGFEYASVLTRASFTLLVTRNRL